MSREFTKSQLESLTAMKTYISSFEGACAFSSIATMQLKILTHNENHEETLQSIKIWVCIIMDVLENVMNPVFQKDLEKLIDDLSNEFPNDVTKQSLQETLLH